MLAGTAAALVAGAVIAWMLVARGGGASSAPPASQGGLVVQSGREEAARLEPGRPLRCFVGGRLVGEITLADCARRNGVASGALDVGLDRGGELAATAPAAAVSNLADDSPAVAPPASPQPTPEVMAATGVADCAQFADGGWVRIAGATSLAGCVRALFDGQCLADGVVSRGRWADQMLRLGGGRVEASRNGAPYRLVVTQGDGCTLRPDSGPTDRG
ncbi:MAG: hypothetical protein ABI056_08765 [Caulobacteraceae bacterium]